MKASIVYNRNEEPRILLEPETDEERTLLDGGPDLQCVRLVHMQSEDAPHDPKGILTDVAYEIYREVDDETQE